MPSLGPATSNSRAADGALDVKLPHTSRFYIRPPSLDYDSTGIRRPELRDCLAVIQGPITGEYRDWC